MKKKKRNKLLNKRTELNNFLLKELEVHSTLPHFRYLISKFMIDNGCEPRSTERIIYFVKSERSLKLLMNFYHYMENSPEDFGDDVLPNHAGDEGFEKSYNTTTKEIASDCKSICKSLLNHVVFAKSQIQIIDKKLRKKKNG